MFGDGELRRLAEDGRPREEERHFDVEDDEQQRDDVKPQVELHEARTDRRLAALVDLELFLCSAAAAAESGRAADSRTETAPPRPRTGRGKRRWRWGWPWLIVRGQVAECSESRCEVDLATAATDYSLRTTDNLLIRPAMDRFDDHLRLRHRRRIDRRPAPRHVERQAARSRRCIRRGCSSSGRGSRP